MERVAADLRVEVVQRIADALGVAVADLFDPATAAAADDDELARRAVSAQDEFVDADALLDAIDEAAGRGRDRI